MRLLYAMIRMFVAVVLFNPVGWAATAVAVWMCNFTPLTALSASFFGLAVSAHHMWTIESSRLVLLTLLVPLYAPLVAQLGFSPEMLVWGFISLGLIAVFQLGRKEEWFKVDNLEPRW